ncbi:nickel pincer cofactor biosynthesis protein LarC [uncultured Lactobacillus sp.]|uniref:nickel pincer cofactor biosynthesis protein LarC n=1 Tax=uncultured Lactobacillus sp. TaxID=153152 RepID=UPI0007BC1F92|nr:nickel pincer cofactor biosynthesis protein LarC [uncultured Lactobacillus sp.]KZT89968.1 hypothetical protein Nizo1840_0261 [Lactiplantibacillus plantarum]
MKTLYLDAFSGISGDMFIGALLDLGIDFSEFQKELTKLHINGYKLTQKRISKSAIFGTDFDVLLDNKVQKDTGYTEHHGQHHGRHLSEIVRLINDSNLDNDVKEHSISIFNDIGRAEAKVHNLKIEDVHFHEVGALDSIVDIVGSCIAVKMLNVDRIVCSTISDGSGFINVAHGSMPIPVPAVAQMLTEKEIPIEQQRDVKTELLTPTGLGIVKEFVSSFESISSNFSFQKVGYGFGKRETGKFNALRVFITESNLSMQINSETKDHVILLETNVDDETGESFGRAMQIFMHEGALDVFFTPIQMKKNRPGIKLSVIVSRQDVDRFTNLIFRNTKAIGVRYQEINRYIMHRSFETVELNGEKIRIKVASYQDVEKKAPEYEDCVKASKQLNEPLDRIFSKVQAILYAKD